jgi:hypothetical protein
MGRKLGMVKERMVYNVFFSGEILKDELVTRILQGLKFQHPNSAQCPMYPSQVHLTKGLNLVPDLASQVPLEF